MPDKSKKERESYQLKINIINGMGMLVCFLYALWTGIMYSLGHMYAKKEYGSGFTQAELAVVYVKVALGIILFLGFFFNNRRLNKRWKAEENARAEAFVKKSRETSKNNNS